MTVITKSSATLDSLVDRVEYILKDDNNIIWSTNALQEAVRQALFEFNLIFRQTLITTLTLTSSSREIDISSLNAIDITHVWFDYDSSDPAYPPHFIDFDIWPGQILYLRSEETPDSGDIIRIWYTKLHTIDELDSATETTFSPLADTAIVTGATAFAALSRAADLVEIVTEDWNEDEHLREWGNSQLKQFQTMLNKLQELT